MRQLSGSVTSSRPIRHSGALAATLLVIVGLLFCSMQGSAAQGVAKQAKVAILSPFSPPEPGIEAFVRELTRLGWVEGQNLSTEVTSVHGKLERLPAGAAELMSNKPDVIFAPGEQGLRAAKRASSATPIVTVACNPLDRLIVSLAAPGGSATGLSCIHSELAGKRLEMLKELVPSLAQVAVLYNPSDPNKHLEFEQLRTAGERLQVTVRAFEMADANGIEEAFASAVSNRAQAVMVLVDAFTIFHNDRGGL